VFLRLEPEGGDRVAARIVRRSRTDGRQFGGGGGGGGLDARRRVGRGHDGRCEVARISGLRMREEAGQRADEWRSEPRVHGQGETRPCGAAQGPHCVVVVESQPRGLHLLLSSPFCPPVLEPHLHTQGKVTLQLSTVNDSAVTVRPLVDKFCNKYVASRWPLAVISIKT